MSLEATQNSSSLWKSLYVQSQGNMFIFQKQVKTDLQLIRFIKFLIRSPEMLGVSRKNIGPWLAKNGNFIIKTVKQRW